MSRSIVIALILLAVTSNLLLILPVQAEIPKPTVPQFTAMYISEPLTYEVYLDNINPSQMQHSDLGAIKIIVTNQEYRYNNGSTFSLYYNVRTRNPTFGDYWSEHFGIIKLFPKGGPRAMFDYSNLCDFVWGFQNSLSQRVVPQSGEVYTTIYLPIISSDTTNSAMRGSLNSEIYSPNAQIDIQIEAIVGVDSTYCYETAFNDGIEVDQPAAAYVTASDWSSTQTVTIGNYATSTPKPTESPINPTMTPAATITPTVTTTPQPQTNVNTDLDWEKVAILVLALAVTALAVGMILLWRRVNSKPVS